MSAFDSCTKTTADSKWRYNNVVFIDVFDNKAFNKELTSDVGSSICSNFLESNKSKILDKTIIGNLNKCKIL